MAYNEYTEFGPVLTRLAVGVVMVVHGVGKLFGIGPAATEVSAFAESVAGLGFPAPIVFAWIAVLVEALGGLCLLIGLFTRIAAVLTAANMLVATLLVHLPNGFIVSDGGFEFTLALLLASLSVAVTGPGRLALDRTKLAGTGWSSPVNV